MRAVTRPTQPARAPRSALAEAMPCTAEWLVQMRARFGDVWIDECVRNGLAGEPGWFHAWEAGYLVGTPARMDLPEVYVMSMSWMTGAPFIAAIREPKGQYNVAVGDASRAQKRKATP